MSSNTNVIFVSEKINKIRWRPDPFNNVHSFITGSYENDPNHIKLWDFKEAEDDCELYPFVVYEYEYCGSVTELKFINADLIVAASDSGSVNLLRIHSSLSKNPEIKDEIIWEKIHVFPNGELSPCTGFTIYDTDIATVGEDGRINLLTCQSKDIVRKIENADSCSIKCATFLKHNELLTSNLRGQMKIWDLRSNRDTPSSTFMMSGDQITPTCLQFHPTQRHLVVAGDEDGSITVWDLRHNLYPVNLLNAHGDGISELQFHPDFPDQLFSCSAAGEIWHWKEKAKQDSGLSEEGSLWLTNENVKSKLDVFALLSKLDNSINCLDVDKNKVLCGCDNEAVYLINGINIFN